MSSPQTRAESSRYLETSRHADVMAFLAALEARRDPRLARQSFGTSPEGRDLPLLVLSTRGVRSPVAARAANLPIVLVINGIHAGEVEGKEASLMLVRDILDGKLGDLLEHMTLLVVPLFNPDGNDRISPENRKLDLANLEGQLGPVSGVGTRVNASGVNLNRDYMRQGALEMQCLQSRVCQPWKPHLTVDCHSTNGSVHRFDLTFDVPHTIESGRSEPILYMRERLLPAVRREVKSQWGHETGWYGNFLVDEKKSGEGWITYTHHPRFGSNYRGLTSRLDVLLETYSYISFEERVHTTYAFLVELLRFTAERPGELLAVVEGCQAPRESIAVRYDLQPFPEPIEILTRSPRTLEGAPTSVTIPHHGRFVGSEVVRRPWAYAVPDSLAAFFRGHGLELSWLGTNTKVLGEVARVDAVHRAGSRKILESTDLGELTLETHAESKGLKLPQGTLYLRTDQPLGAVATYLCEGRSDDSLWSNGLLPEPAVGEELPVLRVLEALE
ncbi:MAG TPA: M14 family metallopeptidase [Planctomycetota bacterium]